MCKPGKMLFRASPVLLVLCSGCAYQYVDDDGNTHVVGFSHVVVPSQELTDSQGMGLTVTTVGVSVINEPSHGGVTLGYSRNSTYAIPVLTGLDEAAGSTQE